MSDEEKKDESGAMENAGSENTTETAGSESGAQGNDENVGTTDSETSAQNAVEPVSIAQLLDCTNKELFLKTYPEESKTITNDFFVSLKNAAADAIKAAEEITTSPEQMAHLQDIVSGFVPFGFRVV